MLDWIKEAFLTFLNWLLELVGWAPKKLFADFLDQMASFIEQVVPPEYMNDAANLLAQWGPAAGYFFDLIEFNWGIQLVISAIMARYAWAKIPFIGHR